MKGNRNAGVLFILSGLIWVLAGNVPIGMMNFCIGIMFLTKSNSRRR